MNRREDVLSIQELLNARLPKYDATLRVDGICGPRTHEAIRAFQQNIMKMPRPDGRIDPQGPTLRFLNNGASASNTPRSTSPQAPTTPTASSSSRIPQSIIQAAQESQRKWNVPASITIAQWSLESSFGTRMPKGSNNPFGIKAAHGQKSVRADTHEVINGVLKPQKDNFRVFSSINEAFDAHGRLLATHPAYGRARQYANDPDAYARALTHTYSTLGEYGTTLISQMRHYNLYQYNN